MDPEKDENSSTSSDTQQILDYDNLNENEKNGGWYIKLKDCIADVACFNRTSKSPLVAVSLHF